MEGCRTPEAVGKHMHRLEPEGFTDGEQLRCGLPRPPPDEWAGAHGLRSRWHPWSRLPIDGRLACVHFDNSAPTHDESLEVLAVVVVDSGAADDEDGR